MELQELLDSKIYVKQKGGITFKSPDNYLNQFVDLVAPFGPDYTISTAAESINANDDAEGTENVAFGRVVVQAKLPTAKYSLLEHDTVIGIAYALDIQKPFLKAYVGRNAWACTNLSIFNADHVFEASLLNNTDPVYDKVKAYIDGLDAGLEKWKAVIERLQSTQYDQKQLDEKLGFMLRKSLKANFTTGIISAAKDITNHKSPYAMKGETTSAWNVLSAVTQYVTDKTDIVMKPDATLFAGGLFAPELKGLSLN